MVKRWGAVIHPQELNERWLARVGEAGITVLGLHPVGGVRAADSLAEMIEEEFLPERQRLYQTARGMGVAIEYEMHALSYLMPRRLFGAHPEWFRMDESGKRTADFNLCASNAQGLAYIEKRAEILAGIFRPDSDRYYFWLDDVSGYRCHCPLCRDLSASDQQLLAVNALQRGVRRANPSGRMAYIAYVDALQTPRAVKPEPGVFLEFAP
nr:DUF4838 domain-containing protein [Clostridia bacterium]